MLTAVACVSLDRLLGELAVDFFTRVDNFFSERALEGLKSTLSLL